MATDAGFIDLDLAYRIFEKYDIPVCKEMHRHKPKTIEAFNSRSVGFDSATAI